MDNLSLNFGLLDLFVLELAADTRYLYRQTTGQMDRRDAVCNATSWRRGCIIM